MSDLRTVAQQALTILEAWKHKGMWGDWDGVTDALKAALVEDAMQKFTDVNQELEAALAEPVEPVKQCMAHGECFGGECIYQRPAEPVQGPVANDDKVICPACCHQFRAIPPNVQQMMLDAGFEPPFTTPPQRKPLTEWQINDLMANIDPEDVDSWSFRQGVYATEKHHGVRK